MKLRHFLPIISVPNLNRTGRIPGSKVFAIGTESKRSSAALKLQYINHLIVALIPDFYNVIILTSGGQ